MLRFLLLVVSVMVAGTSSAGGISRCPVDSVPIQTVGARGSDPVATLSTAKTLVLSGYDPRFRAFVTAVTEHVTTRLGKNKLCLNSAKSKERSLLQFVNWSLATGGRPLAPVPPLDARPSTGCRISSPWIDLAIERKPVPWIRGIVRWNARQLLADQAMLAGAKNVPPGVAMPLTDSEFVHFAYEYEDSELPPRPTTKPLEERVPPDVLWLFRRSWQSTRGPFYGFARGAMDNAMEKGAKGYTKLVIALIDRCLTSDGESLRYNSILDAADLIPLEQYKIDTPIR